MILVKPHLSTRKPGVHAIMSYMQSYPENILAYASAYAGDAAAYM